MNRLFVKTIGFLIAILILVPGCGSMLTTRNPMNQGHFAIIQSNNQPDIISDSDSEEVIDNDFEIELTESICKYDGNIQLPDGYAWFDYLPENRYWEFQLTKMNESETIYFPNEHTDGDFVMTEFSFSPLKNKFAYATITETGFVELWVGDFENCGLELFYSDAKLFFGLKESYPPVFMNWGSGDETLIVTGWPEANEKSLIYSLTSKRITKFDGRCIGHALTSGTGKYAMVCQGGNDEEILVSHTGEVFVEEKDHSNLEIIKTNNISMTQISPDGNKVAYFNAQQIFVISSNDETEIVLPLMKSGYLQHPIKWTKDSQKILIYGDDKSESYCPIGIRDDGDVYEPCWQLLDANTGQVIWSQSDKVVDPLITNHYELSLEFDASLSPDHKRIFLSIAQTPILHSYIYDIETEDIIYFGNFAPSLTKWVDK